MSKYVRKIKNRSKDESVSEILSDNTKRARLYLLIGAIVCLFVGFRYGGVGTPAKEPETKQTADGTSFESEPVKIDSGLLKAPLKDKKKIPPDRITVPSLNIDIPIKSASVKNGYWEVFSDSAGWGVGSAYPDDNGNQVIFAHAREGLFLPLKKAKEGQLIYIFAKDKWYQYKIADIKEVLPSQTEVIAPTDNAILTLYTCSGFSDSKRLIVQAIKIVN